MTGERLLWFELADRLKMSVQRLQEETTSTEFVDWITYLEMEPNLFNVDRWYLAQIAAVTAMCHVKKPRSVKVGDFIMKFEPVGKKRGKADDARSFFSALLGMGKVVSKRRKEHGVQPEPRKVMGSPRPRF